MTILNFSGRGIAGCARMDSSAVQFSLAMQSSHRKDRQCRPQNGDCANVQHLSTSWQPMRGHLAVRPPTQLEGGEETRDRLAFSDGPKYRMSFSALECAHVESPRRRLSRLIPAPRV